MERQGTQPRIRDLTARLTDPNHLAATRATLAEQTAAMRREQERLSRLSRDELLQERGRVCPYCLKPLLPSLVTFNRRTYAGDRVVDDQRYQWVWPDKHDCAEEQQAMLTNRLIQTQSQIQREQAEHARLIERAGLTGLLAGCSFDTFNDRSDWSGSASIRARVRVYANAIEQATLADRPWLILHGAVGTGKSHLAAAVIRQMLDAGRRKCFFRVWGRYLSRIQASWNKQADDDDDTPRESERDIIAEFTTGYVIAIDDLDKRPPTDWTRGVLFDVINTRYNAMLPTILTFNHDIADVALQDYIGEAVFDRVMQHAYDVIEFNGPSFRQRS